MWRRIERKMKEVYKKRTFTRSTEQVWGTVHLCTWVCGKNKNKYGPAITKTLGLPINVL
jgi:hypothetical protein